MHPTSDHINPARLLLSGSLAGLVLLMGACSGSSSDEETPSTDDAGNVFGPDEVSLAGEWLVSDIEQDGARVDPPDSASPRFQIADGRIAGTAGCNQLTGPLVLNDDGSVTVGVLAATRKACPDEALMAFEATLAQVIGQVDRWRRDGDLMVFSGTDVEIIFLPDS